MWAEKDLGLCEMLMALSVSACMLVIDSSPCGQAKKLYQKPRSWKGKFYMFMSGNVINMRKREF